MESQSQNNNNSQRDHTNDEQRHSVGGLSKQVMSHYFGFGNLALERLGNSPGKATGLESSGKFQQKLMLKQRVIEEKMMENRLKKLQNEEERLKKQITTANRHAAFADQVNQRRQTDFDRKQTYNAMMEDKKMSQRDNFNNRREENKRNISNHQNFIQQKNTFNRDELKFMQNRNNSTISNFKIADLNNKQMVTSKIYSTRKQAAQKMQMDKSAYFESIQRVNQHHANEHASQKAKHEGQLRRLEGIEERLIENLQRTLQKKNQAIDNLNQKSPSLKRSMQPRLAYQFKGRGPAGSDSSGFLTVQGGFLKQGTSGISLDQQRAQNNNSEMRAQADAVRGSIGGGESGPGNDDLADRSKLDLDDGKYNNANVTTQ